MSLLPRCICDPFKAIVGDYDPRCSRHIGTPRPTLAPPSVGEYLGLCVCPQPCKWCALEQMSRPARDAEAEYASWFPINPSGVKASDEGQG